MTPSAQSVPILPESSTAQAAAREVPHQNLNDVATLREPWNKAGLSESVLTRGYINPNDQAMFEYDEIHNNPRKSTNST